MKGKLVLEDGAVFYGDMLDERPVLGEVVFNTGMTGYQEILTDPSYCSQIVTLTYPLIGNYGAAKKFNQSRKCFFNGFIIGELCDIGSNWQKEEELAEFLKAQDIPCLYNVDTRAVTRHIRSLPAAWASAAPPASIPAAWWSFPRRTRYGISVRCSIPPTTPMPIRSLPIDRKSVV